MLGKDQFIPGRIFNFDEIGVTIVQNPKKVVTATGTKSVGSVPSGKKGKLVTVLYSVCCRAYFGSYADLPTSAI